MSRYTKNHWAEIYTCNNMLEKTRHCMERKKTIHTLLSSISSSKSSSSSSSSPLTLNTSLCDSQNICRSPSTKIPTHSNLFCVYWRGGRWFDEEGGGVVRTRLHCHPSHPSIHPPVRQKVLWIYRSIVVLSTLHTQSIG